MGGKPVPQLQPASVRLFGKDGKVGKHELRVTAQVTLNVEADGISVPVLLFIQPVCVFFEPTGSAWHWSPRVTITSEFQLLIINRK